MKTCATALGQLSGIDYDLIGLVFVADQHKGSGMIGKTLAQYEILAKLGAGGMGEVYRARDTRLGRQVAIKVLPAEAARNRDLRLRFEREAKAVAAIKHPNIVTIHSVEEVDGVHFITMELVEGRVLSEIQPADGHPLERFYEIALPLADAISSAHSRGITHRDLKPANIMVDDEHRPKILDFGLAKLWAPQNPGSDETIPAGAQLTIPGCILGTAAYMSPEQANGEPTDVRTDVWALGVVLYEMLTGKRPFEGDSAQSMLYQVVNVPHRPVEELNKGVPSSLASVIDRALAKDPADRYSTMTEMRDDLFECRNARSIRKPRALMVGAVLMILTVVLGLVWIGARYLGGDSDEIELRAELFREARQLIADGKDTESFLLLQNAGQDLVDDPALTELLNQCSSAIEVDSDPSGAEVYFKDYLNVEGDWEPWGTTPVQGKRLPLSYLRLRLVKKGYQTRELALHGFAGSFRIDLFTQEETPVGMTYVPSGDGATGAGQVVELPGYWIDIFETTNRAYQEFVDSGGYGEAKYWRHPFVQDGDTLSWEVAMSLFRDATGRPGPATWELGHYPEGEADFPVRGVSWYEAAAYLEYAGKQLPTVFHWRLAAGYGVDGEILLTSNFESDGPAPVGTFSGLGPFGSYDMAGNVQEWCWNDTRGRKYSLGGAWNDPAYQFIETDSDAQPPLSRSSNLGFRGMKALDPFPDQALEDISEPEQDISRVLPAEDEIFAAYLESYAYDPTPLEARIESAVDLEHWRKEKVSFNAAYGQERVPAYLFLPKGVEQPYQTVIFFPGGDARSVSSSEYLVNVRYWDFIIRSGRALMYPVYQNTYERQLGIDNPGPNRKREIITQWAKDIQRSIDYLETRPEIDSENIAYYSLSLGSTYGAIFTAVEPRFKCSILLAGGIFPLPWPPDVQPLNFLPRSTLPTLMVNGRYDFTLPVDTAVRPMLARLGTPEKDKELYLFEGDHIPRANDVVRVTLDWLDCYMGVPR
jgi:tRNA A-37 threonylcarbamoyl transferase component Bud32